MNDNERLKFHHCDSKGRPKRVYDYAILEYLKERQPMFFMGGALYLYENGAYHLNKSGNKLRSMIKDCILPEFRTSRAINQVYGLFETDAELEKTYEQINQYPALWICFKNCMFDAIENKRYPLRPEYFCVNQIPWDLPEKSDVGAGKVTEDYFSTAMSAEDRITIFEHLGLSMTRFNGYRKFIVLKGKGGTGKSRIIKLFENVLGKENCSNVSLQALSERFQAIGLLGRLLNTCADIPSEPIKNAERLKLLTGGEDTINDCFKGRDFVNFVSYAKLLFSSNALITSLDEKSNALFDRVIYIEMMNTPSKADRFLDDKLRREIPYIITLALDGLRKLVADNGYFESARSQQLVMQMYRNSDTVKAFLNEQVVFADGARVKSGELYGAYEKYCAGEKRTALGRNTFFGNLESKGYQSKHTNAGDFFAGMRLKTLQDVREESGENDLPGFIPISNAEQTVFDFAGIRGEQLIHTARG